MRTPTTGVVFVFSRRPPEETKIWKTEERIRQHTGNEHPGAAAKRLPPPFHNAPRTQNAVRRNNTESTLRVERQTPRANAALPTHQACDVTSPVPKRVDLPFDFKHFKNKRPEARCVTPRQSQNPRRHCCFGAKIADQVTGGQAKPTWDNQEHTEKAGARHNNNNNKIHKRKQRQQEICNPQKHGTRRHVAWGFFSRLCELLALINKILLPLPASERAAETLW